MMDGETLRIFSKKLIIANSMKEAMTLIKASIEDKTDVLTDQERDLIDAIMSGLACEYHLCEDACEELCRECNIEY